MQNAPASSIGISRRQSKFILSEATFVHHQSILLSALLLLVTLWLFHSITPFPFVEWDDLLMVTQNPWLHPVSPGHLSHLWTHSYDGLYSPLTYTVYAGLACLSRYYYPIIDLQPSVFHLASLMLHTSNVLLVFALLRRIVKNDLAAFVGALLFGAHPIQAEAVCWVGSFNTLLSTFFSLLALRFYLRFIPTRERRWRFYWIATICFALALLSKPSAVAVPLMAGIIHYLVHRNAEKQDWVGLIGWGSIAAFWVIVTQHAQTISPNIATAIWARPIIAGDALAFYFTKLFVPVNLATDYGRTPAFVLHHSAGYWTWLLPMAIGILAWHRRRQSPWLLLGFGVMVAALVPVLGLVPFAFQKYSTVADRYLYLGMLGPSIALAFFLTHRHRLFSIIATVIVLGLGCLSAIQAQTWRSSEALFTHAISVNPNSAIMHYDLGNVLSHDGKIDLAIVQYQATVHLDPTHAQAHCNLAGLLAQTGQAQFAFTEYLAALRENRNLAEAHYGLGLLFAEHGQTRAAISEWTLTMHLWPNYPDAHYNLAMALLQTGDKMNAKVHLQQALRLNPQFTPANQALSHLK